MELNPVTQSPNTTQHKKPVVDLFKFLRKKECYFTWASSLLSFLCASSRAATFLLRATVRSSASFAANLRCFSTSRSFLRVSSCFSSSDSFYYKRINFFYQETSNCWSSGNAFVSGAGGLRFKSRAGQMGHSVANGSPPLRHFFERSCVAWAQ